MPVNDSILSCCGRGFDSRRLHHLENNMKKVKDSTNKVLEQHKEAFEKLAEKENNKNKDKKDD